MTRGAVSDPLYWLGRYDTDPGLLLDDRTALRLGVRPSEFDHWADTDRARAIAVTLRDRQDEQEHGCPNCHTDPARWVDDHGRLVDPPPFVAEVITCHGCRAKDRVQQEIPDDSVGMFVVMRPAASDVG